MSRHRAEAPSVMDVALAVRAQMTDRQIVDAALALTVRDAAYKAQLNVLGRPVRLENRGSDARMGRFGGGWMTSVGIQMGSRGTRGTIIVNLGKGSIRIDPKKEA